LFEALSTVGVGGYWFGRKPRFDETQLRTLNETKMDCNVKIKSEVHVTSVLIYQYTVVYARTFVTLNDIQRPRISIELLCHALLA